MYLNKTKKQALKIITVCLSFVFIVFNILPQDVFATRSNAGGGDLAEFDVGKWALGTAAGLASFTLGSAISSGIESAVSSNAGFTEGFNKSIVDLSNISTWADKYSISVATTQVSNAFGRMGNYFGWDPKLTLLISSVGNGIVSGGLDPSSVGSGITGSGFNPTGFTNVITSTTTGMALGAVNGAVEGAILMSLADKNGQVPPWAGPVAGLAGTFTTGLITGGLTQNSNFSFDNPFNATDAFNTATGHLLRSISSAGITLGVNYLTQGMGRQDQYIFKQAFTGLYPIAEKTSSLELLYLGFPGKYIGYSDKTK